MDENKIQFFDNKRIRTAWDEEAEEWYFSIVDVIEVLTDRLIIKARLIIGRSQKSV